MSIISTDILTSNSISEQSSLSKRFKFYQNDHKYLSMYLNIKSDALGFKYISTDISVYTRISTDTLKLRQSSFSTL